MTRREKSRKQTNWIGYAVAFLVTIPVASVVMIAIGNTTGKMPVWLTFIAFVVFFMIANGVNRVLRHGGVSTEPPPVVPDVDGEHSPEAGTRVAPSVTSVPSGTPKAQVAKEAIVEVLGEVAGREHGGRFVITETEMQAIDNTPNVFHNVLTLETIEEGLSTRRTWRIVLGKSEGVAFCFALGVVWSFSKDDIRITTDEICLDRPDGRCETFPRESIQGPICLASWLSHSLEDFRQAVEMYDLEFGVWSLLAWQFSEGKDPKSWLSWSLPYSNTAEAIGMLMEDESGCRTFMAALLNDEETLWKAMDNLKRTTSPTERTFLEDLTARAEKQFSNSAKSANGCLAVSGIGCLIPSLILLGIGFSQAIPAGWEVFKRDANGIEFLVLGGLFAAVPIWAVAAASRARARRTRIRGFRDEILSSRTLTCRTRAFRAENSAEGRQIDESTYSPLIEDAAQPSAERGLDDLDEMRREVGQKVRNRVGGPHTEIRRKVRRHAEESSPEQFTSIHSSMVRRRTTRNPFKAGCCVSIGIALLCTISLLILSL